ncbi:STAS domain protein, partial [Pseudomonas sp. FG-3G]
ALAVRNTGRHRAGADRRRADDLHRRRPRRAVAAAPGGDAAHGAGSVADHRNGRRRPATADDGPARGSQGRYPPGDNGPQQGRHGNTRPVQPGCI